MVQAIDIGNFFCEKKLQMKFAIHWLPFHLIFINKWSTGDVPDQLKIAKVIPIFKKDDVDIFSNY